jgi:hypothetical protein
MEVSISMKTKPLLILITLQALAAIQSLYQKLEETRSENAELKARLERLERIFAASTHQ